tara:strand:- start:892 stop:1152 length:261 start_codon:yes stop_codon:yes gene_type:complete
MMNNENNIYTPEQQIDLRNYIREINESSDGGFALTESLEHWAGYGIYTRDQLGDYLDDCVRQEECEDDESDTELMDYYITRMGMNY